MKLVRNWSSCFELKKMHIVYKESYRRSRVRWAGEMDFPLDDSNGRWSLAGATKDNLVYCISVDSTFFDVHLWSFTPLTNGWRLLTKASSDVLSNGHHYCTLSACLSDEMVWAYLETSENTVCLFCFDVQRSSRDALSGVYSMNPEQQMVNFDNTTGPQLVYWRNSLMVGGSALEDYGNVFRVYRLNVEENSKFFVCEEIFRFDLLWQTLTSATILRALVWQDRLTFVEPDKIRCLDVIKQKRADGTIFEDMVLDERSIVVPPAGSRAFFMLDCCAANSGRDLWLINAFGWSKLSLDNSPSLSWTDETVDENPTQILDCCKKCVSSGSYLFWADNASNLRTKLVGLQSLQFLSMKSAMKTFPALTNCSESNVRQFGIPVNIWKKFVGCSTADVGAIETIVMLD